MISLHDRLKIIQNLKNEKKTIKNAPAVNNPSGLLALGWEECGCQVLKRETVLDFAPNININNKLPQAIEILIPDIASIKARGGALPAISDFLFFDLETTGLSGGAGTAAFLAAFGRFIAGGRLLITQYLLLDYPGEKDFLEAVLKEISKPNAVIATYNGKSFDAQVLKTRCLMNGIMPPAFFHADLLHPARRLWKNIIGDCSQAGVETKILGLDRAGDIPGSEAPDIWFEFLKTGNIERLQGICDHNLKDIAGLARMLAAIIKIARDPLGQNDYRYDMRRLAFFWRFFLCRGKRYKLPQYKETLETCVDLLEHVIKADYPKKIKKEAERFLRIYHKRWICDIKF